MRVLRARRCSERPIETLRFDGSTKMAPMIPTPLVKYVATNPYRPISKTSRSYELPDPSAHRGIGPLYYVSSLMQTRPRDIHADTLLSEVLGNVNSTTSALSTYGGVAVPNTSAFAMQNPMASRAQVLSGTISPQSLHSNSRQAWEYKAPSYPTPPSEDSFMSWEPHRRSTEWSP